MILIIGKKENPAFNVIRNLNLIFIILWIIARFEINFLDLPPIIVKFICVCLMLYSLISLSRDKVKFLAINLIVLTLYKFIVFKNEKFSFRMHSNSDPYGVAHASAVLSKDLSFSQIINQYLNATGFTEFIWSTPTPLLSSPYQIPDQQLRYSAEVILADGRTGFPLLFSQLLKIFSEPMIFYKLFMVLGVILSITLFYLTIDLLTTIARKSFSQSKILDGMSFGLLFVTQSWLILMFLEGQIHQIWTLSIQIFLTTIFLRMINFDKRSKKSYFAILPLTVVGVYITYPQILINIFILFAIILIVYILQYDKLKSRIRISDKIIYLVTFLYTGLFIYFNSLLDDPVASKIKDNWGGGAIHIGINNFFDFILPLPGNSLSISQPSYVVIDNGRIIGFVSLLVAVIIQIISFKTSSSRSSGLFVINLVALANGFICLLYLLSPYIISSIILNDYFWFRLQVQFVIFWVPSLILNMYYNKYKFSFNPLILRYIKITFIIFSIFTLKSIGGAYLQHTLLGSPSSCPKIESNLSTYYFSDEYLVNSMALATCGVYKNLSDGNAPVFTGIKSGSIFIYIDPKTLSPKYSIRVKDSIEKITGPCFTDCVLKILA
jgi:hypothetical protein